MDGKSVLLLIVIELKLNTSFSIKSSIPQEISSQINLNTLDKVRVLGPS